jgi:hypothetical protein
VLVLQRILKIPYGRCGLIGESKNDLQCYIVDLNARKLMFIILSTID